MRVAGGTNAKRTDHAEIRDLASKCEDNAVHSYIRDAIIVQSTSIGEKPMLPILTLIGSIRSGADEIPIVWGSLSESGASSLLDYFSTTSSSPSDVRTAPGHSTLAMGPSERSTGLAAFGN